MFLAYPFFVVGTGGAIRKIAPQLWVPTIWKLAFGAIDLQVGVAIQHAMCTTVSRGLLPHLITRVQTDLNIYKRISIRCERYHLAI